MEGNMNRMVLFAVVQIFIIFQFLNVTAQTNLIANGTFENSSSWIFTDNYGTGDGAVSLVDGRYQVEVLIKGSEWWHLKVRQEGFALEQGKRYQLSFDSYSSGNVTIQPVIYNTNSNSVSYLPEWYCNINTTQRTIDTAFTMTAATSGNCTFAFDLGLTGVSTVWLDNVSLIEIPDNRIPELINYPSPTIERRPTLQWHPGTEAVSAYTIEISKDYLFSAESLVVTEMVADTTYTVRSDLPIGEFYWRVKGDDSYWSEISFFKVADARIPELISFPFYNTYETRPTLRWHTPPVAVTGYTVQAATDGAFSNVVLQLPTTDTSFTSSVDLPVGDIYWRVKAEDSEYSFSDHFVIIDPRIPMIYDIPNLTDNMRQPIAWNPITGATAYTIQLAYDNQFDTLIATLTQSDTLYTPLTDLPVDQIYCRVKSDLLDEWSPADLFMVLSDTIPVLFRYDNAVLTTQRPEFRWKSVEGATSYKLEYANNISFTDASVIPLSDTSYIPVVDLAEGNWFWRVSSSRDFNKYSLSDYFSINLSAEVPVITSQPQDAVRSEGESVTFSIAGSSTTQITYKWFKNGVVIANSNSVDLIINNLSVSDSGSTYHCVLTNKVGSVTSDTVMLSVDKKTSASFINKYSGDFAVKLKNAGILYSGNSKDVKSISLIDMRGRLICYKKINHNVIVLDEENLFSSGCYLLKINLKNREIKKSFIYTR